jgi:hypothetical protein
LAELVFGTGKDAVGFVRTLNASGAIASTPVIATTSSCIDGLNTLRLSSGTETTQAGYLFYKTAAAGAPRWQNITYTHSSNYIGYDRDKLDKVMAEGNQKVFLVHTHPMSRPEGHGLSMRGHGPSAADLGALCTFNNPSLSHLTIDEFGVWESTHQSGTCPFTSSDTTLLARIEIYLALATLSAAEREPELDALVDSPLTSPDHRSYFSTLDGAALATMSTEDIIANSRGSQGTAGITVTHFESVNAFCNSLE